MLLFGAELIEKFGKFQQKYFPYQAGDKLTILGCIIFRPTTPLAAFYWKLFTVNWSQDIWIKIFLF